MSIEFAVFVIAWLLFAIASAFIAHTKGRDAGSWFLLGLLLGIIAVVIIAVSDTKTALDKQNPSGKRTPWQCPKCRQNNAYWDERCVKCGAERI
jgi:hypothetical protein